MSNLTDSLFCSIPVHSILLLDFFFEEIDCEGKTIAELEATISQMQVTLEFLP